MQQLEFYIGVPLTQVPEPDNWQSLQIEASFENGSPDAVLNSTKLVWKGANATYLNSWVKQGINGGVGIFEGIPLVIKVCTTQEVVFDGIIDLTDPDTRFACDIIQCKIRDKRMDMVSQLMDSVSYSYLATPTSAGGAGIINPRPQSQGGDYVIIPYQRNNVPDYIELFTLGIMIFTVAEKIRDITIKLATMTVGDSAAAADTAAKAGLDADGTIYGTIEIVGYIVYMVAMIILLFELIKSAFNYLISPVFTKFGMYAKDLLTRACQYFGIGFSSSIFSDPTFSRLVVMPSKSAWSDNRTLVNTLLGNFGITSIGNQMQYDDLYNWQTNGSGNNLAAYGYYDGTCGDFIRAMEEVFNAKAKIIPNSQGQPILHFERWDYQYDLSTYTLPNISDQAPFNSHGLFNTTGYSQSAFGTNAHELPANYMVRYSMDDSDENTYNAYEGTMCYCTTRPITSITVKNVLLQNLVQKNLPFAQAYRKNFDTAPEVVMAFIYSIYATIHNIFAWVFNTFILIYNAVTSLFSAPPIAQIPNLSLTPSFAQVGHLLLSGNTTGIPKMFIAGSTQQYKSLGFGDYNGRSFTGVTIDQNNRGEINMSAPNISARALMRDFHFSSLPQTTVPQAPYSHPYNPGSTYYNQYLMYKNQQIPMCCSEYNKIKDNNEITTFDGKTAKVLSLRWNLFKGMADIDYKIQQQYTKNLQTSFVVDGKEVTQTL